jgi:membrane peptidoglycan carboxypeptidase
MAKKASAKKPKKIHDLVPMKEETSHDLVPVDDTLFALPSETAARQADQYLVEDGHYKDRTPGVIRKGSKIGTEFNTDKITDLPEREKTFVGRKGSAKWSENVEELRKKFGFSWQRFGRKFAISGAVLALIVAIMTTAVSVVAINIWDNTRSIDDLERDPNESSVVFARDGTTKIFEFFKEERREVLPLCQADVPVSDQDNCIPKEFQLAVIALEDENFYQNDQGIPWTNLVGASARCLLSVGDECRGASGISQQLIKNITDDDERSIDRKVRELFTAVKLNQNSSKTEILEKYLNWVPFGRNAYGAQQATQSYFNKDVKNINIVEACYLASMVQLPTYFESGVNRLPEANHEKVNGELPGTEEQQAALSLDDNLTAARDLEFRKDVCLQKLTEISLPLADGTTGLYIADSVELEELQDRPVSSTTDALLAVQARDEGKTAFVTLPVTDPYPHFREYITKELANIITENQLYEEGYEIITTLDPDIQKQTEDVIVNSEDTIKQYGADNAAGVVVDGPTGEILAMVGSLDYNREDIDGKVNITTSPQQPGSSVKPYVYAAAFQNGFNPGSIIIDADTDWNGGTYDPKNFDGGFRGPVSMRRALQGSLNIPAVKTLFLVNDDPVSNQDSKLKTFFDFAEKVGVRFPCVEGAGNINKFGAANNGVETCTPSEERGITQEMIDDAYRGRCFIASALGGCELTMVSHTTGINTFLQDGNLRTSTPFISITKKSTGEDVYAQRQASDNAPYPQVDADEDMRLLSRQMAAVMSDSNARIPEFGSARFNLQLDNPGIQVAAKTGTSNGPRDFWTVGGSPYYTVSVWVGKTDNGAMARLASSSATAAPVWNGIMESIHEGKEARSFSTEGLQSVFVSSQTGLRNAEGDPQPTGTTELLTPWQIDSLNKARGVVAANTAADLDSARADIFTTRTSVVPVTYSINRVDGKLFVDGLTLDANKEEVKCLFLAGEFQAANWQAALPGLAENNEAYCVIPEPSDQDQVGAATNPPSFNYNVTAGLNSVSTVTFNAAFSGVGQSAAEVRLYKDGALVASTAGSSLSYNVGSLGLGPMELRFEAVDNFGLSYAENLSAVEFDPIPLTVNQISGMSCTSVAAGNQTSCTFSVTTDPVYTYSTISVQIQGAAGTGSCTITAGSANCANVPTTGLTAGSYTIRVRIDGGAAQSTGQQVTLT